MSGTDHTAPADAALAGLFVVLVHPQLGENIGASARAMWNFGLDRLRLVAPRDGWPNPAAVAMASGAGRLLDDAQLFPTTADAVADAHAIYATTARPREMTKRVLAPESALAEIRAHCSAGRKAAILFGPERAGLANDDIVLADTIISVPVNPAFGSLNLAQCVLLCAYEWRRSAGTPPADEPERAPAEDVTRLLAHLADALDRARFFWPEHKRPAMLSNLENLFRRAPLTEQDVRTLWGVIRALAEGPKGKR